MENPLGQGHFVTHLVNKNGVWLPPRHSWTPNTWVYEWGEIATQCIVNGDVNYAIAGMYIEYENVADPADPVTIEDIDRAEGVDYYNALASSGTRDYLRVALSPFQELSVIPGYEDFLGTGRHNRAAIGAQTSGDVGVHGKAFTTAANSKVCGIAVVATPDPDDPTKDVVFARAYHAVDDQTVKPASSQIAVTYRLEFK